MNDRTVREHIREGAGTLAELAAACRAGTECEDCQPRLLRLIEEETRRGDPSSS